MIPRGDLSYSSYLKIADTMLYDAKRFGRNQVVWAGESMQQWLERPQDQQQVQEMKEFV